MGFSTYNSSVSSLVSRCNAKTHSWIDEHARLVYRVFPDPESHPLHDDRDARLLPRRRFALPLHLLHKLRLDVEDTLLHPVRLHDGTLGRMQPAKRPLAHPLRRIQARKVGRLDEVLGNDVERALLRRQQVRERVLCILVPAREAQHEERRIVRDHVEVAEGSQVGALAVRRDGRHEANGARGDAGDEELVVVHGRAAFCVRVDFPVLLLEVGRVVRAGAEFPVGLGRLDEVDCAVFLEVGARGFDAFEVGMGVALDLRFGVCSALRHCGLRS